MIIHCVVDFAQITPYCTCTCMFCRLLDDFRTPDMKLGLKKWEFTTLSDTEVSLVFVK